MGFVVRVKIAMFTTFGFGHGFQLNVVGTIINLLLNYLIQVY